MKKRMQNGHYIPRKTRKRSGDDSQPRNAPDRTMKTLFVFDECSGSYDFVGESAKLILAVPNPIPKEFFK